MEKKTTGVAELGQEFSTAVVLFHDAVAQRLGLTAIDHRALGVILREGPLSATQLACRLDMKPSAVTGLVDRLVDAGHVTRTGDPADRRRVIIAADGGERCELSGIFRRLGADMAEVSGGYTLDQLAAVLDFLSRATTVLRDHTGRLNVEADGTGVTATASHGHETPHDDRRGDPSLHIRRLRGFR
ncbi:MAG TPA: MarR family transcriptional regulator [Candidatus Stackebrandtia excrementipullorum]|nr:MarR family transcriptional regulator [Candidatus Stackebrandtia excrementipullorum]